MILRVMIVEDEDMIRNGLVKTLPWADMGCTIIGSFVLLIFNFRKIRLSDGAIPEGVKFRNICGAMYGNLGTVAFILVSLITMAFFLSR